MKVLFLGAHFPRPNNPIIGVWALSELIALRDSGCQVRVISPVPAIPRWISWITRRGSASLCPAHHTWSGVEVHYVRWPVFYVGALGSFMRSNPGFYLALGWMYAAARFLRIAKAFKPDVIYSHHAQLAGFAAAKLGRELSIPFYITEHDFDEIDSCETSFSRKRHYASVIQGIACWIAVADRLRDSMRRLFPQVPVVTIRNGADAIPPRVIENPRPAWLAGRLVMLCVSFFYQRKNVPRLIRAFDSVAGDFPGAVLVIIGDGDDKPAVVQAREAARHRAQVFLLGSLPHAEVLQYMAWCDVFASVGINEPFATVFTEAMMAGKPIIYGQDGGIAEVAKSGVHGLGVDANSDAAVVAAIRSLMENQELRVRMGANARLLANTHLSWAAHANALKALFAKRASMSA